MFRMLTCFLLATVTLASLAATPGGKSGTYAIQTDVLDGGGQLATSALYSNVGSFGHVEGSGAATPYAAGHGYIAQITGFTAPSITPIQNLRINKNSTTGALSFTVGDAETSAASLLVTASSGNATLVPNTNITLSGTTASRTVTVVPATDKFGTVNITLTVTDGEGGKASTTFALDINDTPLLVNNKVQSVFSQSFTDIQAANLLVSDGDNAPATLIYTLTAAPQSGSLRFFAVGGGPASSGGTVLNAGSTFTQDDINNQRIRYTNFSGTSDGFSFTLSDGRGGVLPATAFGLSVAPGGGPGDPVKVTSTISTNVSVAKSPTAQSAPLSASVIATGVTVVGGTVTFTVQDANNVNVGAPVVSSPIVKDGAASVSYPLPADLPIGTYSIFADYSGTESFKPSSDRTKKLVVIQPGGLQPPTVQIVSVSRNPVRTGVPVTITAQGNSFSGLPLNFTWLLFAHGSQTATGGPLQTGPGSSLTFTFPNEGDFDIGVLADDGFNAASTAQRVQVVPLAPNPNGSGTNIANLTSDTSSSTVGIDIGDSLAGVIDLNVVNTGKARANDSDFAPIVARTGPLIDQPIANGAFKFTKPQIAVVQAREVIPPNTLGAVVAQRMIAISQREVDAPVASVRAPDDKGMKNLKLSAKFNFNATKRIDTMKLSFDIVLPEGLDLTTGKSIYVGLGNVILKYSGGLKKGSVATQDDFGTTVNLSDKSSVIIKAKGYKSGLTKPNTTATVSVNMVGPNLVASGFEYLNINADTATRSIPKMECLFLLEGISYRQLVDGNYVKGKTSSTMTVGK